MIKNRKGFSLVELIVTVTVLGILAAILVPSFVSSTIDSQKSADESKINELATTIQIAAQNGSIYKDVKKMADKSDDGKITIKYVVDDNDVLKYEQCSTVVKNITMTDKGSDNQELVDLMSKINNYVNGIIEPIKLDSRTYRANDLLIILTCDPNVQYRVNVEIKTVKPQSTDS